MSLKNRSFLKLLDYTPAEIEELLDLAADLKARKKAGIRHNEQLAGKNIALIFEKTSTRTRCSFEVAAHDLGMEVTYLDPSGSQIGKKESIADTARVLGRYYDCVVWRTYRQSDLEEFAEFAGVPVINGLTDYAHPCQVLADLMTIRERRGALAGQKLCFVGDGSNMANSLIVGGLLSGMKVDCVCPHGYRPAADVLVFAHKYGSAFRLLEDPAEGVKDAILMAVRVMALIAGTSLLTYTTSPIVLTDAIEQLLKPLGRLHFPVHELAMMMSIALRFIPTLIEETDKIMNAQKARGAMLDNGSMMERVKALVPVLIPLFISAFRRADELAMAMECRCYRGGDGRTRLKVLRCTRQDYIDLAVCIVCFMVILSSRLVFPNF